MEAHCRLDDQVQTRTSELQQEVVDRKRAEDNLRELTGRLLSMRDDEQRRIARELHDSAGQILTAATMEVAIVSRESQKLSPQAAKAAAEVGNLLQDALREIRTLSHLLHPPLLDEAGLTSAVRWYAEGFAERSKIKVELDLAEDFGRLSRELETTIFRIIQESLTNIHRHSQSETARIRLQLSTDKVRVEIEDEGCGIGAEELATLQTESSRGVGIRGMRERVRQMGGALEIASKPQGTLIVATFPIASPAPDHRSPGR
ncbi:MAG: sensor histidine kinase [Acidobacteriales bacterium]|nr:sensor histidine kinase [Terriglobales bacterium]